MPTWAYILCGVAVLIVWGGLTWWVAGDALDWEV